MKESKNRFLAFSFGDYEGVRACLDALAAEGWELTGRSGWLTMWFPPIPAAGRRQWKPRLRRAGGWAGNR